MKLKDILKQHIEAMKNREDEQRHISDVAIYRRDTIQSERFKLEAVLDRLDEENRDFYPLGGGTLR